MERYRTIVADPPWPEHGGGRIKRGADRHYPLMNVREIAALGSWVRERTHPEGCHIYLWATNNYLADALGVMTAWGFRYITCITWAKEGAPGLGQYYRGKTEHCLFGIRGQLPYRTLADGKRAQGTTLIMAPRGRHSEKPEDLQEMAERVSHGPYLEMFARRQRPGWDTWGNDTTTTAQIGA